MAKKSTFQKMFGPESAARQILIWGVASQLISAVMAPALEEIAQQMNELAPLTPLTPTQVAEMAVRRIMQPDEAAAEAKKSGIDAHRFERILKASGTTPDISLLVRALQRGIITRDGDGDGKPTFMAALEDSTIRPEWYPIIEKMGIQIPTVAEVMDAWLQGQIEEPEARQRYQQAGGDMTWFQTSYNANGSAPTPNEAAVMANRGIIPWDGSGPEAVTFEQAFLEGPWRNKWQKPWRKLAEYLPPARTITAMQRSGALSAEQALSLYKKLGLSPELAQAYLKDAMHTSHTADKDLAKGDVLNLFHQKVITEAQALKMLEALHYSETNAKYILAIGTVQKASSAVTQAISRTRTLYVGHKIDAKAATDLLAHLGVPADRSKELMDVWELEEAANVKTLTDAQIMKAWELKLMSEADALENLIVNGHTKYDSWLLLSIHNGEALPNKPAKGPNPIGKTP